MMLKPWQREILLSLRYTIERILATLIALVIARKIIGL
jgi:hypothetical protein